MVQLFLGGGQDCNLGPWKKRAVVEAWAMLGAGLMILWAVARINQLYAIARDVWPMGVGGRWRGPAMSQLRRGIFWDYQDH